MDNIYAEYRGKVPAGLQFIYEPEPSTQSLIAYCDRASVKQVVSNLVSNAIKFTHKGYIKMWIHTEGRTLEFHVQDTGIGIPTDQFDNIFETFVKLDIFNVGTGLGLSISKSIAKKMGGDIHLDSTYGKGSHFWLSIPFLYSTDDAAREDMRRNTLMVAEDQELMLFVSLCLEGLHVMRTNASEALNLWLERKPHLTIIDLRTCADTADVFIGDIRNQGNEYKIVALNYTGLGLTDEQLYRFGADVVVTMPTSHERFTNLIESLLSADHA